MSLVLTLYGRAGCCLCAEMKAVLSQAATRIALTIEEIDVDTDVRLQQEYGAQIPVLFINGRKAFKYRVTLRELQKKLKAEEQREME